MRPEPHLADSRTTSTAASGRPSIRIFGTVLGQVDLSRLFEEGGTEALRRLEGEFVIVVSGPGPGLTRIVSSTYGFSQYFFHCDGRSFVHGPTVYDVVRSAGLAWEHDEVALCHLAAIEQMVGDETLHARVKRVPAGTVMTWDGCNLKSGSRSWTDGIDGPPTTPGEALESFNASVARLAGADNVVSMSSGFDSRLILSALLKLGHRPRLLTMGEPSSTDVVIARRIARRMKLDIQVVSLEAKNYLENGLEIARLTGGTKTANHWHTYVYAALGRDWLGASPFFVGTNGEFARAFFTDLGGVARAVDRLFPVAGIRHGWLERLVPVQRRTFKPKEIDHLRPSLRDAHTEAGLRSMAEYFASLCGTTSYIHGFQKFYLEHRIRCFMSNGVRLLQAFNTKTPALDREWVRRVWNLSARWKLGSNWHRFAISQNAPPLMEIDIDKEAGPLPVEAPPFYYLPTSHQRTIVPYVDYRSLFVSDLIRSFVLDNRGCLADLMTPRLVEGIVMLHRRFRVRTKTLGFMLCQIFWRLALASLPGPGGRVDGESAKRA
jgi:asparagine synthetase B (glutamine-hydrolysing)